MFNKLRLVQPQQWNENIGVWLRTPWFLRQWIPRQWLVWEWLLNWNSSDSSGYGNNGTATNVTYTWTDIWYQSQCAVFNWSSSRVVIRPYNSPWDIFTISLFLKTTLTNSERLVYDRTINLVNIPRIFISINRSSINGNLSFWWFNGTTVSSISSWNIGINDGTWKHIVWTRDGNNTNLMYVNGILVSTTWSIPSGNIGTGSSLTLWDDDSLNAFWFNGNLQLVRDYNRALSAKEIQSLYKEWLKLLH